MNSSYNYNKVESYWDERSKLGDKSVMSLKDKDIINKYYSMWEEELVFNSISNVKGLSILDVACGVGRYIVRLSAFGNNVTGIDISQKMLDICKKKLDDILCDKYTLIRCSSDDIKINKKFDVILCAGLFEHLPVEQQLITIDKMNKLLKTDGKIILVINNDKSIFLRCYKEIQKDNGYYLNLTCNKTILNKFKSLDFDIKCIGINPHFAIISHMFTDVSNIEYFLKDALKKDLDIKEFTGIHSFLTEHLCYVFRRK